MKYIDSNAIDLPVACIELNINITSLGNNFLPQTRHYMAKHCLQHPKIKLQLELNIKINVIYILVSVQSYYRFKITRIIDY